MKTIVVLPGEGIGIEVIDATCEVLVGTGLPLKLETPPQGAAATKSHGTPLPEETKRAAREADGVLFGAAVWLGLDEITLALLGLAKPPTHYPASRHAMGLVSHLAYGVTVDTVWRALRRARRATRPPTGSGRRRCAGYRRSAS